MEILGTIAAVQDFELWKWKQGIEYLLLL